MAPIHIKQVARPSLNKDTEAKGRMITRSISEEVGIQAAVQNIFYFEIYIYIFLKNYF
jgi:hypothetical protein